MWAARVVGLFLFFLVWGVLKGGVSGLSLSLSLVSVYEVRKGWILGHCLFFFLPLYLGFLKVGCRVSLSLSLSLPSVYGAQVA